MTATTWVVGSGGLLGSAVVRRLRTEHSSVHEGPRVAWGTATAHDGLQGGLASLIDAAAGGSWQVIWCAGAGVTDSGTDVLETERRAFQAFLDAVRRLARETVDRGVVVLASSAGAVYGGSVAPPYTEDSIAAPLGAYGEAKLRSEQALRALSSDTGTPVVICRIANIYGPGQNLSKQQGLVSRLCLSAVTRKPVSVYVSLDTRRDYIYVDDCARRLIACGRRAALKEGNDRQHVKIVASGQSTSIAALLGHFRHVSGPRPLVVMGSSLNSALQSRDLRLLSTTWTDLDAGPATPMATGIDRTMADLRSWLQRGRLQLEQP